LQATVHAENPIYQQLKTNCMKLLMISFFLLIACSVSAQDTTIASMNEPVEIEKKPVKIFNSIKAINAKTTEVVGKGKMEFNVTHNFGDIGGKFGGLKNFFGLDNTVDVRIGFEIGLGERFDLILARAKGASQQTKLWEMGIKWQLMRQLENDPSHPLAMAIFANTVIASNTAATADNLDHSFRDFSDRLSHTFQLIIAQKIGRFSWQLNPTIVTRNYAIDYDQKTFFALGGAVRVPVAENFNIIVDYFHPFRSQESKDSFAKQAVPLKFYDPLGIGFEIITPGHIFHLNFTNANEILENRFIPRSTNSWGKGQFRWGFTIARSFVLWRPKEKETTY
jgi:hypothetical protein